MITALVGPPGVGKSYFLMFKAYQEICKGRIVYANFTINFPLLVTLACARGDVRRGTRRCASRAEALTVMGRWRPVRTFSQIVNIKNGVFLFDEAHLWLFSRAWADVPWEMVFWMSQSRKAEVDVVFAAQRWDSVDATLRELAHERLTGRFRIFKRFVYRADDPQVGKRVGKGGLRLIPFDPAIACLYNTHEILAPPSWSTADGKQSRRERKALVLVPGQPRAYPDQLMTAYYRQALERGQRPHYGSARPTGRTLPRQALVSRSGAIFRDVPKDARTNGADRTQATGAAATVEGAAFVVPGATPQAHDAEGDAGGERGGQERGPSAREVTLEAGVRI